MRLKYRQEMTRTMRSLSTFCCTPVERISSVFISLIRLQKYYPNACTYSIYTSPFRIPEEMTENACLNCTLCLQLFLAQSLFSWTAWHSTSEVSLSWLRALGHVCRSSCCQYPALCLLPACILQLLNPYAGLRLLGPTQRMEKLLGNECQSTGPSLLWALDV